MVVGAESQRMKEVMGEGGGKMVKREKEETEREREREGER